jgi:hypothetical protein
MIAFRGNSRDYGPTSGKVDGPSDGDFSRVTVYGQRPGAEPESGTLNIGIHPFSGEQSMASTHFLEAQLRFSWESHFGVQILGAITQTSASSPGLEASSNPGHHQRSSSHWRSRGKALAVLAVTAFHPKITKTLRNPDVDALEMPLANAKYSLIHISEESCYRISVRII